MRAKKRLFHAVALGATILLAAPADADWWDWAAPRVDASLAAERDRDDRDRDGEDVGPRPERDRDRDGRDEGRGDDGRERGEGRDRDGRDGRRDDDGRERGEGRDRDGRDGRRDDDRRERGESRDRGRSESRGGPTGGDQGEMAAFCRSGEGHPVFGMSWCQGERSGPSFCRTGEGHPQRGMGWCFENGFVPGTARWRPRDLGDVVFDPSPRRRADGGTFGERVLADILGDATFGQLVSHRGTLGIDERLEGRWHVPQERDSARVLQVRSGGLPIAELSDLDGDGRVEVALVLEP